MGRWLDVYEPKGDSVRAGRPAVLAIHGGAWMAGRRGGTWPAQIEDVQKALKHIRANARLFRTDPERIASLGMSAGGHLATMVAVRDDPTSPMRARDDAPERRKEASS